MTDEEKTLIGEAGNILAIGRSGTGKTTCALLRLFATEILFKFRSATANKAILKDTRFNAEDVDANCGLHSIFVTASPVLTNEVRRYYEKLKEKIKTELINRDKRKEASQMEIIKKSEIEEIIPKPAEKTEGTSLAKLFEEIKEIEDDLDIIDEGEIEKQLALAHSLNSISDNQFPLFLTVRRLLLMIDGTTHRPFFARNPKGEIIGLEGNAEWHNEIRGVMMINTMHKITDDSDVSAYSRMENEDPGRLIEEIEKDENNEENDIGEFEYEEEVERREIERKKAASKPKNIKTQYMGKEVDFETFANKFWPTLVGKVQLNYSSQAGKINAASVWREIQTHIKGSVEAHEFACHNIPQYRYIEITKNSTIYDYADQKKIYEIFYRYENWCLNNNYFDMSDVVNHILSQIKWNGYHGLPIHFVMCDEVQDLPPATLLLLLKIAEQNLFFSGDTAQTIAKGVNFRFADLKDLFYQANISSGIPAIMQLTINFRSHARILDVANSIIRALELFFPTSIDKLRKEKSPIDGPIPVVLDSELQETLFNLLLGSQQQQALSDANAPTGLLSKPPIEFGCDQVIIVRNQQAKKNLPRFLKHALCLTIYEAKGLEFDDVILYNFFTDSEVKDEWKLMKSLIVEDYKVPLNFSEDTNIKQNFDQLTVQPGSISDKYKDLKPGEYEIIKNVKSVVPVNSLEGKHSLFTTELKHLYTAITRPRKRLIIFDEDPSIRKPLLDYWLSLGYVNVITKEEISDLSPSSKTVSSTKQLLESLAGKNTSKTGWRAQGVRMFRRKYYEQAMKCFENSGDIELKCRSEAYFLATSGSELSAEIDALKYSLSTETMKKSEKVEINDQIALKTEEMINSFRKAAETFGKLNLKMQSGQCYFSIQEYEKAALNFIEAGLLGQAGEAYFKLGKFIEAGELYEKAKVPSNAIIAYENAKDWERVLQCLYEFKDEFQYDQRTKLVKKYVQLALQAIFEEYENSQENEPSKNNKELEPIDEKIADQLDSKISVIEKPAENISAEIINKPPLAIENELLKKSEIALEKSEKMSETSGNPFEEVNLSKSSEFNPFDEKEPAKKPSAKKPKQDEDNKSEFSVISKDSAAMSKKQEKSMLDMDHISGLDPEDEWIQCETGSIIDSVVSGKITPSNRESDYSMLDNAHAFAVNCSLVKTKRDIFVEDQIMAKVIRYVSYFSEEVRSQFETLRSKSALLHTKPEDSMHTKKAADFIIDMDDITLPFVNLLLDILESYGLYKLCIIICNRYQINDRIGRYIVSIGHKYSNIKLICEGFEKYAYPNTETLVDMQIKNAIIANMAVHGVFEVVNPIYLKMKKFAEMIDETNSLGRYCYRSMLLLGYWKKLVYTMDCQSSLALTSTFADYYNYKMIYLINFGQLTKENIVEKQKSAKSCTFSWLPFTNLPSNRFEQHAAILALDSVIYELNKKFKFTFNFGKTAESIIPVKKCPDFPRDLFPNNKALWEYIFEPNEKNQSELLKILEKSCNEFMNIDKTNYDFSKTILDTEYHIWDFVVFLIQLLYASYNNVNIQTFFLNTPSLTYNTLLQCYHKLLSLFRFGKTNKQFSEHYYTAFLAFLSSFGIRRTEGRDLRLGYGRTFVVSRNSICFTVAAQFAYAKREQKRKELEETITRDMQNKMQILTKTEFETLMQTRLREAMENEHSILSNNSEVYFADLEAEYLFVPPDLLSEYLSERIVQQLQKITVARFEEKDVEITEREILIDIWNIKSKQELLEETRKIALKIGEISFTLKLMAMYVPRAKECLFKNAENNNQISSLSRKTPATISNYCSFNKSDIKEAAISKKKQKITRYDTEILDIIKMRSTLFFKLKYLSVNLFENGLHSHINSESYILHMIQHTIRETFSRSLLDSHNNLFQTFCTYLAAEKYILYVEQLRTLCRSKEYSKIGYQHNTWLDAMAEHNSKCYDDCLEHLMQFLDENEREITAFSKISIIEKIITLGLVMLNSIIPKSGKEKELVLCMNSMKHMDFVKSNIAGESHKFSFKVFKHKPNYDGEEAYIFKMCKMALKSAVDANTFSFGPKKRKVFYDVIQALMISLLLNIRERSQYNDLIAIWKSNPGLASVRLNQVLEETLFDEWLAYQEQVKKLPKILIIFGIHENEFSFPFDIATISLIHDNLAKPNLEKLEKDSLKECRQIAIHKMIYKTLRDKHPNKDIVKSYKKPFAHEKYDIISEIKTFGYNISSGTVQKFWEDRSQSANYYQLIENIKDVHMIVLNTFYKTPIFNVLDAHYLFTLLEQIDEYYVSMLKIMGETMKNMEPNTELVKKVNTANVKEIRDEIEKMKVELKIWKNNKFLPDKEYIEKKKIVYRIKWQQHKQKEYQKRMSKKANLKRQELLMKKADILKGKFKDVIVGKI